MGYKTVYGIDIYPKNKINIFAILNENIQKTQLFVYPNTDPIEIHLELNDMVYLNRPSEGGANNIFGFAHELGHVVMMFDDSDFGQGFATYFGIHITDYIKTQLGEKAWPYSYDYVSNEGSGMIEKIKNKNNKSYSEKIVLGLEQLDNMYGKKCIVDTITKLKDDDNSRLMFTYFNGKSISFKVYKKDDFIRELFQISGDQNIKTLFEK